jgi:hypothetical protein
MGYRIAKIAALGLIMAGATAAYAQQPAAPAAPAKPAEYMVINIEGEVINKPAAEVWSKIGKYCDLGVWMQGAACQITAGKDGEAGAVRSIAGGRVIEVMVSATPLSYTYAQPLAPDSYHGKLEVRPVTATTSKIHYMIFRDQSSLADQAAKDRDRTQRTTQFTTAVNNMKIIAEGGTLPAPAGRGGGGGGAAPGRGG